MARNPHSGNQHVVPRGEANGRLLVNVIQEQLQWFQLRGRL